MPGQLTLRFHVGGVRRHPEGSGGAVPRLDDRAETGEAGIGSFLEALRHGADLVLLLEPGGRIRLQGDGATRTLGHEPGDLVGSPLLEHVHPRDWSSLTAGAEGDTANRRRRREVTLRLRDADGGWVRLEGRSLPVELDGDEAVLLLLRVAGEERSGGADPAAPSRPAAPTSGEGTGGGSPQRTEAERDRPDRLRILDRAIRSADQGVMITEPDGTIAWVDPTFEELTGYPADEAVGADPSLLKSGEHDDAFYRKLWTTVLAGEVWTGEMVNQRRDGSRYVERQTIVPVRDGDGDVGHLVAFKRDVTERRERREQLRRQALRDPLTGLASRALFEDRVDQAIARARRRSTTAAVLMIDLHRAGADGGPDGTPVDDRVVEEMAVRLARCLREEDTLGRWEEDALVVLLEELEAISDLPALLERMLPELERPVETARGPVEVEATVGAVVHGRASQPAAVQVEEARSLLRCARRALYRARRDPETTFHLFRPPGRRDESPPGEVERLRDLRHGLEAGELEVYYQPVVGLGDGEPWGLEPLARWRHGDELFAPDEFIPLAEREGLIQELGRAVLERVRRDLRAWRREGVAVTGLRLLPNVSGRQFESGEIVDVVRRFVERSALDPSGVLLEVPESSLLRATGRIEALRGLGIRVLVDDFGTGSASLRHLRDLAVDGLKVDMSFVQGLGEGRGNSAVLDAALTLGRGMDLQVIAEGVETAGQRDTLREMGCELAQGFFFARPVPAGKIPDLLEGGTGSGPGRGGPAGAPHLPARP